MTGPVKPEAMKVIGVAALDLERFAQALRNAHCANGGADHPCVGRVTISAQGCELACSKCGNGEELIAPPYTDKIVTVARAAFGAIGLEWTALSPEAQRSVHDAVKRLDLVRRRGEP